MYTITLIYERAIVHYVSAKLTGKEFEMFTSSTGLNSKFNSKEVSKNQHVSVTPHNAKNFSSIEENFMTLTVTEFTNTNVTASIDAPITIKEAKELIKELKAAIRKVEKEEF